MKKIQLSHRMYSIRDIKRLHDAKELVTQPKYQRRRTPWPPSAKTSLIDTIVCNYPIPPIYVRAYVDDNRQSRTEIIDGQQRITTILEFLNGVYSLTNTFSDQDFVGSSFNDLPDDVQDSIYEYELSCMSIRGATESDIIAIFSRMNSFSLPLNEQEKRNAVFAGEFKTTVFDIASQYHTFWRSFDVLSDASIARMKDAELVSELFAVIMQGLKAVESKAIDKIYARLDEHFPARSQYQQMFTHIISYIGALFDNEDIRLHFRKTSWFFPLFLILYIKSGGSVSSETLPILTKPDLKNIIARLTSFIDIYKRGALPPEIRLLFQQGSKSPSKIQQRLDYLLSVVNGS